RHRLRHILTFIISRSSDHRDLLSFPTRRSSDLAPDAGRSLEEEAQASPVPTEVFQSLDDIVAAAVALPPGTHLVIMSNGGFGGVHGKIMAALAQQEGFNAH